MRIHLVSLFVLLVSEFVTSAPIPVSRFRGSERIGWQPRSTKDDQQGLAFLDFPLVDNSTSTSTPTLPKTRHLEKRWVSPPLTKEIPGTMMMQANDRNVAVKFQPSALYLPALSKQKQIQPIMKYQHRTFSGFDVAGPLLLLITMVFAVKGIQTTAKRSKTTQQSANTLWTQQGHTINDGIHAPLIPGKPIL